MSDEQKKDNEIEEKKLTEEQLDDVSGGLINRTSSARRRVADRGARPVSDVSGETEDPAADPTSGKISDANVSGPSAPVPGLGGASARRRRTT